MLIPRNPFSSRLTSQNHSYTMRAAQQQVAQVFVPCPSFSVPVVIPSEEENRMKLYTKLAIGCILGTALLTISWSQSGAQTSTTTFIKARAVISGPPGSPVKGEVLFVQAKGGVVPGVLIVARVEGLA